jgi:hypothetical protein
LRRKLSEEQFHVRLDLPYLWHELTLWEILGRISSPESLAVLEQWSEVDGCWKFSVPALNTAGGATLFHDSLCLSARFSRSFCEALWLQVQPCAHLSFHTACKRKVILFVKSSAIPTLAKYIIIIRLFSS